MKSHSTVSACLVLLAVAVAVCPPPCRADDYITYSVPFSAQSPVPGMDPHLGTTFAETPAEGMFHGKSIGVQKYTINLSGIGWAFNPDTGIQTKFGAVQYTFDDDPETSLIPRNETEVYGSMGLWRKLSPAWTATFGLNGSLAGDPAHYSGREIFPGFSAALNYHPRENFSMYAQLAETRIDGSSYLGLSAGFGWDFAPRWHLSSGLALSSSHGVDLFARMVVSYQLTDRLSIFGGVLSDGALFNVNQVPGNPSWRNALLEYEQNDLKVGVDFKVAKAWDVRVSLGYPLNQQFRYRR